MEFYLESYCGKAFLRLIARGSTIVAELLRLSNNIPQIFYPGSSDNSKYKDLLFDFNYLRNIEEYDEKVTHLPDYETLEDNLFDKYCDIIERFMRLFESINRYNDDLNTLVEEIKDNFYAESMDVRIRFDVDFDDFRICWVWRTVSRCSLRVTTTSGSFLSSLKTSSLDQSGSRL